MNEVEKIKITADCSSGLEYAPFSHHIQLTRTCIYFDKEEFVDGIDITADSFYEKLKTTSMIPTTSAPTLQEILKTIEDAKKEGYTDIIHFPISFGLSTYGQSLKNRIDDLDLNIRYHVFNSNTACLMQGYTAKYAEILADKHYSVATIFEECEKLSRQIRAYFVVDDLKYLVKSGRLGQLRGYIGDIIKIKPIITFNEEGKLVTHEQVRTHRKAIERCIQLVLEQVKSLKDFILLVGHTGRYEDALEIQKRLQKEVPNAKRIEIFTIAPTVGAHIGNGILGVGCINLEGLKEEL